MRRDVPLKERVSDLLLDLGLYWRIQAWRGLGAERAAAQRQFYSALLGPADTVFDVGANVGQRAAIFASLCGKVVAVEPQEYCLRHLRSRFRSESKVVIVPVALAEKDGQGTLYESDSHTISSMSPEFIKEVGARVFAGNRWETGRTVAVRSLDSLVREHGRPHLVKIDVEGYELQVLRGLAEPVPLVSFEFTPIQIDQALACVGRLQEISPAYLFNYCLGEDLRFRRTQHADYTGFLQEVAPLVAKAPTFGDIYALLPGAVSGSAKSSAFFPDTGG
jgi:FkbM family methyltransferase